MPGKIISRGSYQGYGAKRCGWRRSQGWQPESGFVVLNLRDVKEIVAKPRNVPWRGVTTAGEDRGGLTIQAWKLGKAVTKSRVEPLPNPTGGGFNYFGDLFLQSAVSDDGNSFVDETPEIYRDIYIRPSGVEGIMKDLLRQRDHDTGDMRVPLVDIRHFWQRHGVIAQSINRKNGRVKFLKGTIDKDTDEPWSTTDTFRFILSQLPGSCDLEVTSIVFLDTLGEAKPVLVDAPVLAIRVLAKMLDDYGLAISLQPDNSVLINRQRTNRVPAGKIPVEIGNFIDGGDQNEEARTFTLHDRSPMLQVFGPRRLKRTSQPYVPVFQDIDSRIFRLEDIEKIWGYTLARVNKQTLTNNEKAFDDVPPRFGETFTDPPPVAGALAKAARFVRRFLSASDSAGNIHARRREILRNWAYRGYAPAALFVRAIAEKRTQNGAPFITDEDFEQWDKLPMKKCPVYDSELKLINIAAWIDPQGPKGDIDEVVLVPPVVRARQVGIGTFSNGIEIELYFRQLRNAIRGDVNMWRRMAGQARLRFRDRLKYIKTGELQLEQTFDSKLTESEWVAEQGAAVFLNKDIVIAAEQVGSKFETGKIRANRMTDLTDPAIQAAKEDLEVINRYLDNAQKARESVDRWELREERLKQVMENLGAVQLRTNIMQRVIEETGYTLDPRTGIIMFTKDPACAMDEPFLLDTDSGTVIGDGTVQVQWGYESQENSIEDWTSVLFTATSDDEDAQLAIVGINRTSPIKARMVNAEDMRLYETDLGSPMNLNQVLGTATAKAGAHLQQPLQTVGFTYRYPGLRKAVLDAGVSSIQHVLELDTGHTSIAVNAPGSINQPFGPAEFGQRFESIELDAIATVKVGQEADLE